MTGALPRLTFLLPAAVPGSLGLLAGPAIRPRWNPTSTA